MKAGKAFGGLIVAAGTAVSLAGLCAAVLPKMEIAGLQNALNALQSASDSPLHTAVSFGMSNGWLVLGAGLGAVLLGVLLIALSARAARKRARLAAEARRSRLLEQKKQTAAEPAFPVGNSSPPIGGFEDEEAYRDPCRTAAQPAAEETPWQSWQPQPTQASVSNPFVRPLGSEVAWPAAAEAENTWPSFETQQTDLTAAVQKQEAFEAYPPQENPFRRPLPQEWPVPPLAEAAENPREKLWDETQFYPPVMDEEDQEDKGETESLWSPALQVKPAAPKPAPEPDRVWGARYVLTETQPLQPQPEAMPVSKAEPVQSIPAVPEIKPENLESLYTPNEPPASELMQPASSRIRLTVGRRPGQRTE